jgi:hypothetical protein
MCETGAETLIGRGLDKIHLRSHPCMHFTNSSVRQVACVKGKIPLLHDVWMELEYQLDELVVYRVTSSAHIEHFQMVK